MVRVTDRVIKLLIDLRQPSKHNPVENMEQHCHKMQHMQHLRWIFADI